MSEVVGALRQFVTVVLALLGYLKADGFWTDVFAKSAPWLSSPVNGLVTALLSVGLLSILQPRTRGQVAWLDIAGEQDVSTEPLAVPLLPSGMSTYRISVELDSPTIVAALLRRLLVGAGIRFVIEPAQSQLEFVVQSGEDAEQVGRGVGFRITARKPRSPMTYYAQIGIRATGGGLPVASMQTALDQKLLVDKRFARAIVWVLHMQSPVQTMKVTKVSA